MIFGPEESPGVVEIRAKGPRDSPLALLYRMSKRSLPPSDHTTWRMPASSIAAEGTAAGPGGSLKTITGPISPGEVPARTSSESPDRPTRMLSRADTPSVHRIFLSTHKGRSRFLIGRQGNHCVGHKCRYPAVFYGFSSCDSPRRNASRGAEPAGARRGPMWRRADSASPGPRERKRLLT